VAVTTRFHSGNGNTDLPKNTAIIMPIMTALQMDSAHEKGKFDLALVQRNFITTGTGLANKRVDYVILFNILHAENPVAILSEAF
jgi:hypothetical protein